jgi:hypothetical protein
MEELIAATILEEEVYCVSERATDIFSKIRHHGNYSGLIGTYLMGSEMKFREFVQSFERYFPVY